MKVAVSIPDAVFEEGEFLARRMATTRSNIYARALGAFVAAHAPDQMTEAMNAVIDAVGPEIDPFVAEAGRQMLARGEW
jgi:metal-responsive CopG/Arc/MetJ family transcriptional regulator